MGLVARGAWDLPGPGIEPVPPALAGRLNYWTAREVPNACTLSTYSSSSPYIKLRPICTFK